MELFPAVEVSQMMHLNWTCAVFFSSSSVLPILHWRFSCECVWGRSCSTHIAPTSFASLLQLNSSSSFSSSLRVVLVSPGFPPSNVSVALDPGLFSSLSTMGDGFCYHCQLLPRSFSLRFFKTVGMEQETLKEIVSWCIWCISSKNTCRDQETNLQWRSFQAHFEIISCFPLTVLLSFSFIFSFLLRPNKGLFPVLSFYSPNAATLPVAHKKKRISLLIHTDMSAITVNKWGWDNW